MTVTRTLGTGLLLALLMAPAAAAQSREQLQLLADLRMVQEQVSRLQLAATQIADRLAALDKRLDTEKEAAIKAAADEQLRLNALSQSVGIIREKLDDNTTRAAQQAQELTTLLASIRIINDRLNTLTTLLQPAVNPVDPDAPAASLAGSEPLPPSPTNLLKQAMEDYFGNNLDLAIEGFQEFVAKFPEAPDAAKAQFHIGQSYFNQKKYKEALAAFGKVISDYKDPEWVPQAYYSQGWTYEQMKQPAAARRAYETVNKLYPDSSSALLAQQRLKAQSTQ
jgi:tol-pal system protein YbgF